MADNNQEVVKIYTIDFDDNGIFEADDFYVSLRAHDKYYANLMKKVFKKYIKKYVDYSSLLRDAFLGE